MAKRQPQEISNSSTRQDIIEYLVQNAKIPKSEQKPLSEVGFKNPDGTYRYPNVCANGDDEFDWLSDSKSRPDAKVHDQIVIELPMVDEDGKPLEDLH